MILPNYNSGTTFDMLISCCFSIFLGLVVVCYDYFNFFGSRYVCRLFVRRSGNPSEIMSELKAKVGFCPDDEIVLYEEVKFERYHEQEFDSCVMCERLDKTISFGSSQIRNGDIICFQKLSQDWDKYEYPDVPSFLEYVKNRQVVHFRSKDKPKEEAFSLELSKLHTYDDVARKVANKLGLDDPSKIMFTAHNSNLNPPDSNFPIKYQVEGHLLDMLGDCNKGYDILYYQIFEIPLPDLEGLTNLKVAFYQPTNKEEPVIHSIWLPNQSTVGDVLTEINRKVNVDAQLRLLQLDRHKILEVFRPTLKIEYIDYEVGPLRAEKIPEEEKVLGPGDRRIDVYHFTKEQEVKNFGEPFFLVIREHETLADVKLRIRLMLEVPHDEFSKWKFAIVYRTNPEYLQDSDIVSSGFQRTMYVYSDQPYLGLEHLEQPVCLE
ncbi:hypothetical protein LXL04_013143 [Taraxacum kok-saghyz]